MTHHYFAIIEAGYATQFPAIPDDQLPVFYEIPQETVSLTEEQHSAFSAYRAGRIKYLYGVFSYDPDSAHPEMKWITVRARRNALLRTTDWVVIKATESGQPVDPAWVAYRQALRDITGQADPFSVVWPTPPVT